MTKASFCFLLLSTFTQVIFSQTIISGKIFEFGSRGHQPWNVELKDGTGDTTFLQFTLDPDGSFRASVFEPGPFLIQFVSPGQKAIQSALPIVGHQTVALNVTLDISEQTIKFHDSASTLARFAMVNMNSKKRIQRYMQELRTFQSSGKDFKEFSVDWEDETNSLVKQIALEKNPLLKEELILQYIELGGLASKAVSMDRIREFIINVPPESPAWVYHSNLSSQSPAWHPDSVDYLKRIIARHPSRHLRARLLYENVRMARARSNEQEFRSNYAELMSKYPDTKWAKEALKRKLSPVPALTIGSLVPQFSLPSIGGIQPVVTEKTIRGIPYLIDFWATWCVPCVGEMSYLHNAYERFGGRNFVILSVSLDVSKTDVEKYRTGKWKMPWIHAWAEKGFQNETVLAVGVLYIPFPLLVDPDGKIVALGQDLRGENLEATLEKFLVK